MVDIAYFVCGIYNDGDDSFITSPIGMYAVL